MTCQYIAVELTTGPKLLRIGGREHMERIVSGARPVGEHKKWAAGQRPERRLHGLIAFDTCFSATKDYIKLVEYACVVVLHLQHSSPLMIRLKKSRS